MTDLHPRSTVKRTHRMYRCKRAQIRSNFGSRFGANAPSADRAFAPDVTDNTAYFTFSFLFAKRMTPMICESCVAGAARLILARFSCKQEKQT